MIFPTAHARQTYRPRIRQRYQLDLPTGIQTAGQQPGALPALAHGRVALALNEIGSTQEFGTIGERHFVGRDEVLARFAVAELAEFGGSGGVEVSRGGEDGGDVFAAGYLILFVRK